MRVFDGSALSNDCPSARSPLCRQVESARSAAQSRGLSLRFWAEREREPRAPAPATPSPAKGHGGHGGRQAAPSFPVRGVSALPAAPVLGGHRAGGRARHVGLGNCTVVPRAGKKCNLC